ncbi:ATP-binding protein [Leifsonia sp. H3M29-4]|uniref:sensor histidine kinase n=1 Tax=Salinibacterium metalliresistens TaxID=3031321 RepID=UPI0023D99F18|nr:ATP-binding protein [Salinibacterium metalliresistens]MDF1478165.1 ATP-binding protein [Salinibacterium metalliresistens]
MDELTEWWNRISLRTKITGVTVLLLTMGLLVAGIGTMAVLRAYLLDEVDADLKEAVGTLDPVVDLEGVRTFDGESYSRLNRFYFAAVDADGVLIDDNLESDQASMRPDVSGLTLLRLQELPTQLTLTNAKHTVEWRVLALPGRLVGTGEQATLVIGIDLGESNAIVARYVAIFLFFGLTVVILGGALTRLLVTTTFTPLREVEATAARFADGDFNQRLSGATPNTEVGRLNRSLNSMLGRIDRAFADRAKTIDQMRRFVGDASHELRTPLVSVRGYAELYRMGALTTPEDVAQAMERIEKEAIRMGELVEDLLELARIDEAKPLQLTEVDLVPLANDAALDAMASAPDRVVTVIGTDIAPSDRHVEEADPQTKVLELPDLTPPSTPSRGVASLATGPIAFANATLARMRRSRVKPSEPQPVVPEPPTPALRAIVLAEENKLRQVLANLIGNALRFTPAGSPIEIGVGVDADRRLAILSVIDHGEGIPPQIRDKIFQRFWRADTSRTRDTGGSGLGLAIVSAIVEAHRGEVEVVETPGGGATFRVLLALLPRSGDAPALPKAP